MVFSHSTLTTLTDRDRLSRRWLAAYRLGLVTRREARAALLSHGVNPSVAEAMLDRLTRAIAEAERLGGCCDG